MISRRDRGFHRLGVVLAVPGLLSAVVGVSAAGEQPPRQPCKSTFTPGLPPRVGYPLPPLHFPPRRSTAETEQHKGVPSSVEPPSTENAGSWGCVL